MDEVVPNNLKKNFPQPNDFWKLFKNGETRFREGIIFLNTVSRN